MSQWQGRIDDEGLDTAWQELAVQAKDKPWLLKLLSERGAALATRYALWKRRLGRLRQGDRRRLQRRLGVGLSGAALLLALAASPGLGAPGATMTVTDGTSTILSNSACSLPEAIINANNDASTYADCGPGSGPDTITLGTDVTLTLALDTTYGNSGLPVITSPITIEGNGRTISRSSSASVDFRVMAVGAFGDLTLNSATISGGVATPASVTVAVSGAVTPDAVGYSYGGGVYLFSSTTTALGVSAQSRAIDPRPSATIRYSTISGNQADYGGGVYAGGAVLVIENSTISGNSAAVAGGGLYAWDYTTASVSYSTLSGNSAVYTGGGVQNGYYSELYMVGAVVSGNTAASGAGIFNANSSLAVGYSSIADNNFYGTTTVQANATAGDGAALDRIAARWRASQELHASRASGDTEARRERRVRESGQAAAQDAASPAHYYDYEGGGGGIFNLGGFAIVYASEVTGNSMPIGAGVVNAFSYPPFAGLIVAFSTISGNTALGMTTVLQSSGASPAATAIYYAGVGGGVAQVLSYGYVVHSTLTGNTAAYGGGMANVGSFGVLINSTLSGNSAGYLGGGIANEDGYLHLDYSTIVGNTASYGGGIHSYGGTTTVVSSVVPRLPEGASPLMRSEWAQRLSEGKGSGRLAEALERVAAGAEAHLAESRVSGQAAPKRTTYAEIILHGNVISGNTAMGITAAGAGLISPDPVSLNGNELHFVYSSYYFSGYNVFGHDGETNAQAFTGFTLDSSDIDATSDGDSVALASIVSTSLADNDSPVVAGVPPGAVVQTLALPEGSPAIDHVPNDWCEGGGSFWSEEIDQRTKPRKVDGDGVPSDNECDAGAYELQTEPIPRIIVHKQTLPDGDTTPFAFRLRGPVGRDFTLTDNQPHSTGLIPAGIYTLEEVLPPGWDPAIPLSSLTCDDGSPLSAVDLAADEVLVCRFLNYKRGNIVVKKVTIPAIAAPSFNMRLINNTSLAKTFFSLANTQQFDTGAISSVPTYKLLETVPGGWKRKNIVCSNGSPSTAIAIPPGGTVTCTVTNENSVPSNIVLSSTSVAENKAIGTLVGNLSATDAVAGDTHTFSFVNDGTPAAANNGNFQIVGSQLKTAKKFDFETKSSHNIKLQVTDSAGQTKVKAFVITIVDGPN